MRDPVRLIESLDDDKGRLLLRAGRQGPPRGAKERSFAAATVVFAASAVGGGSAAAAGTATAAVAVGSGKWLAVVGLASLGALGGTAIVQQVQHSRASSATATATASPSARPPMASPRVAPPAVPTAPAATAPAEVAAPEPDVSQRAIAPPETPSPKPTDGRASRSAAPSVAAAAPTVSSSLSFSAELQSLDEARAAVAAKEPARALAILDGYHARFPRGAMAPEATVLRIEALTSAGDHAAAERVAEAFLRDNPGSPYAPRVHSLLGSNP
jgi:hypothetical protein